MLLQCWRETIRIIERRVDKLTSRVGFNHWLIHAPRIVRAYASCAISHRIDRSDVADISRRGQLGNERPRIASDVNRFLCESHVALLRVPQGNRYRANAIIRRGFPIFLGQISVANSARHSLAAVRLLVKQNFNRNAGVRVCTSFIHNARDRYRVRDVLHRSENTWVKVSHGRCGRQAESPNKLRRRL